MISSVLPEYKVSQHAPSLSQKYMAPVFSFRLWHLPQSVPLGMWVQSLWNLKLWFPRTIMKVENNLSMEKVSKPTMLFVHALIYFFSIL